MNEIILDGNLISSLLITLVGGIISSFSPCMISTLPIIIGYLNVDSKNNKKMSNFIYAVAFSLGIIIVFISLGVISVVLGKSLRLFGSAWYIFLGTILILVSLKFFGVFSENKVCKRPILKKSFVGAFFVGIIGGFFESPCSTPVLVGILAFISQSQNILYGIILMIFYSVGHCFIIFIAGLSIDTITKFANNEKYIKINGIFKVIFGILCLIFSLYLFYLGF